MTLVDRCQGAAGHLEALRATGALDSPQAFDRLARFAGGLLQAPVALISLLEEDRQTLVSAQGLPESFASRGQIPLAHSLCKHVVDRNAPLVIADARRHPLGQDNLAVHELNMIAYLGVPLLGPDGELLGAVCVIDSIPRDWSEADIETLSVISQAVTSEFGAHLYRRARDRLHEALRVGEARSTEILESIDDAFYAIDHDWRFRYVNRHAERLWGRRREDLLGRPIFEIFPAFAGSESHHACMRALAEGVPARIETISRILGVPVEMNIFPSPSGLSVYFRDISDRRRMEQALRERDQILSLAERSAGIGVWDVDLASGTVRGTPQFFELFGLRPSPEVSIETMRALRHPDDQERVIQGFKNAVESGTDHYEMEYRIIRPSGELRWIFGRGRVVRDATGRPVRYSGIDIDVTERKRMEEHQKLLLAELSHRVKNTLATIQSIAKQSLVDGTPLGDARDAFIRRLHALAHTHSLLTESAWRGAKLSALVEDELRPYGDHASCHGQDLILVPKAALTLGLVLHELATNAAKHGALSDPAGRIEVSWQVDDEVFHLAWREHGGPPVRPPARRGFGSRLLERAVTYELSGQASLEFSPDGVRYDLTAPLRELASPA